MKHGSLKYVGIQMAPTGDDGSYLCCVVTTLAHLAAVVDAHLFELVSI